MKEIGKHMKKRSNVMMYTLEWQGSEVEAQVSGTYYKGSAGSYWDPPEGPEVDDLEVMLDGKDIALELDEKTVESIVEDYIMWMQDASYYDEEEAERFRYE